MREKKYIVLWLLGALDGRGEIRKRILICVMLSRVYVIETRNRLTKYNTSSTNSGRVKGRDSQFQVFCFILSLKQTTLCKDNVWAFTIRFLKVAL